ncbi:hypothetical protein PTKIN_Ptkin12aG0151300 [Pterospermum kingtungense]
MLLKFPVMIFTGSGGGGSVSATYSHVVRTGVPKAHGGRNRALVRIPFLLIVLGTIGLGGLNATSAVVASEVVAKGLGVDADVLFADIDSPSQYPNTEGKKLWRYLLAPIFLVILVKWKAIEKMSTSLCGRTPAATN